MKSAFDIPVCLLFFKRTDKLVQIISVVRQIAPSKVYLLSDGPRNEKEKEEIDSVRQLVVSQIDWPCSITRIFHPNNVGVYQNIGMGALEVFKTEPEAIFLEDDNLPALSFFEYCKDCLEHYREDPNVLWICGTNYLSPMDLGGDDCCFTRHLLPCGWASWSYKFTRFYDGDLSTFSDEKKQQNFRSTYRDKRLYHQQYTSIKNEFDRIRKGEKPLSWDYQMVFSVRSNLLYGIAPRINLIDNIGVDALSIHGGTTNQNVMTKRFCNVPTSELKFPLTFPSKMDVNPVFEKRIGNTILFPLKTRVRTKIKKIIIKLHLGKLLPHHEAK
jgi:hypothetical protein